MPNLHTCGITLFEQRDVYIPHPAENGMVYLSYPVNVFVPSTLSSISVMKNRPLKIILNDNNRKNTKEIEMIHYENNIIGDFRRKLLKKFNKNY
jgi:hypothetical protein